VYIISRIPLTIFITALSFLSLSTVTAQSILRQQTLASNNIVAAKTVSAPGTPKQNPDVPEDETAPALTNGAKEQKRLLGYLKHLNVPEEQAGYTSRRRFYYRLAGVFAHLRLYPLAMKCFLKTQADDTRQQVSTDTLHLYANGLAIASQDDSVVNKQIVPFPEKEIKSKKISSSRIHSIFNDGKTAAGYAMLFHVKQPVRGKRKIFLWANTGHTFITLIKYNTDSTYVSASFGFYPSKDQLLSATPFAPSTSSTLKDDSKHQWDEVLGKFISRRRFEKILALTSAYENLDYDLNKNNCTDFGIQAAGIAGIKITETRGRWPMGSGNNPGITGQSILEGKYANIDTADLTTLFVDNE